MAWRQRSDPFKERLRQHVTFETDALRRQYLDALGSTLTWLRDERVSAVIADGLVKDCPIVAASDMFLKETDRCLEKILYGDIRQVLNNLFYPSLGKESLSVSKSSCLKLQHYCDLARFPGAVTGGSSFHTTQLNVTTEDQACANNFVVFRMHIAGHPLLIATQSFSSVQTLDELDQQITQGAHFAPIEVHLKNICHRLALDKHVTCFLEFLNSDYQRVPSNYGPRLYHGPNASSKCVFHNGGRSVLRQEPQTLPRLGLVYTANPLESTRDGSLTYSLRVDDIVDWEEETMAMGFTRTPPTKSSEETLHNVDDTTGFTIVGVISDNWCRPTPAPIGQKHSGTQSQPGFPRRLACGDILAVELTASGLLQRYLNGVMVSSENTGARREGIWYGVFEVAFNVARVTLLNDTIPTPIAGGPDHQRCCVSALQAEAVNCEHLQANISNCC